LAKNNENEIRNIQGSFYFFGYLLKPDVESGNCFFKKVIKKPRETLTFHIFENKIKNQQLAKT
jgi:hypothetical protein